MKKNNNTITAKVNKEIGGYDYRGYHIDRDKKIKSLIVTINGDEIAVKTLGEAKKVIDEVIIEMEDLETRKIEEIHFVSKRGVEYLISLKDGKIRAYTYEEGKKTYWQVTEEIKKFVDYNF